MSTPLKIDRGIPIPPAGRAHKYPLRDMKVGDSFFVPFSVSPNANISVRSSAAYVARTISGFRITLRKETRGWRVWRTA